MARPPSNLYRKLLTLRDSGKATSLHLLGIKLKSILGKFESLLNKSSKLSDTATLLSEDFLCVCVCVCGANDIIYK